MTAQCDTDSYDEDLAWILQRLAERAGASSGLIVRFCESGSNPRVLAQHDEGSTLPPGAVSELCSTLCTTPAWQGVKSLPIDLRAVNGGVVRLLALRFNPAPEVFVVAAICRPETSFNLLQGYIAARLEPALGRYVRLWWLHRSERRRAEIFQLAIDRSDVGLLLLDQRCRLLYSNPEAELLFKPGGGLRRCGRGISTIDETQTHRLALALQSAVETNAANAALGRNAASALLAVPRIDRRSLIVSVAAVERPVVDTADAAVIVYVLDPDNDVSAMLAPAFRIYRLTATESRLVARLVKGADLTDAAASLNLAVQTARSYMKQIFHKTGTNRQAELVRVMCASAARAAMVGDLSML
jgi:DNA-binding CsgD family transcriptional regulator